MRQLTESRGATEATLSSFSGERVVLSERKRNPTLPALAGGRGALSLSPERLSFVRFLP